MSAEITTIALGRRLQVNCYLVRTSATSWVLIDSGVASKRDDVAEELERAGCGPGDLRLVVVTHGDPDHIGNCRWLRDTYRVPIAMHKADAGMAERGDMFWGRTGGSAVGRGLVRAMLVVFRLGLHPEDRFTPDILLADGQSLAEWGFDATVVALPGHSSGSIGVLTAEGDLLCGDLLDNSGGSPGMPRTVDDRAAMEASVKRAKAMVTGTVYPGHGKPFPIGELR